MPASTFTWSDLTEDLSWDKHIQNTVSKGNRSVGFLRRNLRDCTPPVKASTFKIMVRPILEYASPVWDPHQQANIKALEQVQRRAARYVFNDYSTRTPECITKMLDALEWEPLEVRRKHDRLSILFRMQHNLVDIPANRYLGPVVQSIVSLTTSLRCHLVKYIPTTLSNTLLFFVGKM